MDVMGDYTIQKKLGSGPLAEVYLAEHRFIKKKFALKLLPEVICRDASFMKRFEEEISLIAALDHPNIVPIHNISSFEGRYFIVTDPVVDSLDETMHLGRFLEKKGASLSESEKHDLLSQIASALDYAHEKELVHGAIKPTNLLVRAREDCVEVVLSDFGLTHLIGEGLSLHRLCMAVSESLLPYQFSPKKASALSRCWMDNFYFLAPEQKSLDGKEATSAADTYAFGILSYYILMGRVPEGCFELPSKALTESKNNWDLFINRCLQMNPYVRPQKITLAMNEYLAAPSMVSQEVMSLSEVEGKLENNLQMAFEFSSKSAQATVSIPEKETAVATALKPMLKPQEITRPEYEPDPGAIFQREMTVSRYTPTQIEIHEVEPLLSEMVIIPGGSYHRGSGDGARDEMPRHQIHLRSFALDVHPVTNEQFVRFLEAMGGEKDQNNNDIIRLRDSRIKRSAGKLIIESGYAKHPVIGITWYGAVAYAKWIGKRLPSEAEWEIAASSGKEHCIYPTGDEVDRTQANFFNSDTTSVMSYPPNTFGLYDMAGNVYEWCQDWYAYNYYDTSALEPDQPEGPHQGVYRVLRGGGWKSSKEDMRTSHRHRNNPGAVNGTYGFRCAADVIPE